MQQYKIYGKRFVCRMETLLVLFLHSSFFSTNLISFVNIPLVLMGPRTIVLYLCFPYFRFTQFLKDVLKLPAAVGERQTFNITDSPPDMIFEDGIKVTVNDFLEPMMSDPGPQSVSWLLVLHRLSCTLQWL